MSRRCLATNTDASVRPLPARWPRELVVAGSLSYSSTIIHPTALFSSLSSIFVSACPAVLTTGKSTASYNASLSGPCRVDDGASSLQPCIASHSRPFHASRRLVVVGSPLQQIPHRLFSRRYVSIEILIRSSSSCWYPFTRAWALTGPPHLLFSPGRLYQVGASTHSYGASSHMVPSCSDKEPSVRVRLQGHHWLGYHRCRDPGKGYGRRHRSEEGPCACFPSDEDDGHQ